MDFVLKENVMMLQIHIHKIHNVIHGQQDVLLMEKVVNHQLLVQIFRAKIHVEQLLDVNGLLHAELQLIRAVL
jgi:poly(A) polymerase Pap1